MTRNGSPAKPVHSGLWCIIAGIAVATAGGVLCLRHLSLAGPILMLAGLTVFGLGLLLQIRAGALPDRKQ